MSVLLLCLELVDCSAARARRAHLLMTDERLLEIEVHATVAVDVPARKMLVL